MREKCPGLKLCVSPVLMQNQHIWNLHSSLTLDNRKLIWYFRSPWYTIVSNMSHDFILFGMRDKMASFELGVSPVLMENQHIWNFHRPLTLNKGTLIWHSGRLCRLLCQMWFILTLRPYFLLNKQKYCYSRISCWWISCQPSIQMNILLNGIWLQRMDCQSYHKLDICKLHKSAASVIS